MSRQASYTRPGVVPRGHKKRTHPTGPRRVGTSFVPTRPGPTDYPDRYKTCPCAIKRRTPGPASFRVGTESVPTLPPPAPRRVGTSFVPTRPGPTDHPDQYQTFPCPAKHLTPVPASFRVGTESVPTLPSSKQPPYRSPSVATALHLIRTRNCSATQPVRP